MIDLKAKPFYLNDAQIAWVEETLAGMSEDQKAEQLFCPMLQFTDKGFIDQIMGDHEFGSFMMRIKYKSDARVFVRPLGEEEIVSSAREIASKTFAPL